MYEYEPHPLFVHTEDMAEVLSAPAAAGRNMEPQHDDTLPGKILLHIGHTITTHNLP